MPWNLLSGRVRVVLVAVALGFACTVSAMDSTDRGSRRIQTGLASYYGPGFHGERTASGEVFDQNELVAAHPTLPFGTVVRVTNLENGRQVRLRVTDRGPYGKGRFHNRIIDVSKGAAHRLRFVREGVVRVRVEVVKRAQEC